MKKALLLGVSVLGLAACQGDGGGGGGGGSSSGSDTTSVSVPSIIDTSGDWLRGYVSNFDSAAVAAVRQTAAFVTQSMPFTLTVTGHPVYGETAQGESNYLEAAGVDYAHSLGLTGKGQTLAFIDGGVLDTHEQFEGKTLTVMGVESNESHGTSVLAVAAGNGVGDTAIGVAPQADLFLGTIGFSDVINWSDLAGKVTAAQEAGAIALGNSWGIGVNAESFDYDTFLSSADGGEYVSSLKNFAKSGVIVFAADNDYTAESVAAMAALPLYVPALEKSFLAVINVIPDYEDDGISSGTRVSQPCAEAARFCIAANGLVRTATGESDDSYGIDFGTSFSQPQVVGALALLAEAFPDLSQTQLRNRLLLTADNSWFTTTKTLSFGDGLTHGYDEEFGHGFLNLKAALLPIGDVILTTASGDEVNITGGEMLLVGSALSGDAIAEALSDVTIIVKDAMDASYDVSASALAGEIAPRSWGEERLSRLMSSDLGAQRRNLRALTFGGAAGPAPLDVSLMAATAGGQAPIVAPLGEGMLFHGVSDDVYQSSEISQMWSGAGWHASLGVGSSTETGSILGMTVSGGDVFSRHDFLTASAGVTLAQDMSLRGYAEIGRSDVSGLPRSYKISDLAFGSGGVSLDFADVLKTGDILSIGVERPSGIFSGEMTIALPVSGAGYEDVSIDMAPEDRQTDFVLTWRAPLSGGAEVYAGYRGSENYGHRRGAGAEELMAGIKMRF